MTAPQGSLELLNDPIAQELLRSTTPARLAYAWPVGTPRMVPIWFHWTGEEVVMGGPAGMPGCVCPAVSTATRRKDS
jgi:hypothetical protein